MKPKAIMSSFKRCIGGQLDGAVLQQQVGEALNAIRSKQDLMALRGTRPLTEKTRQGALPTVGHERGHALGLERGYRR